MAPKHYVVTAVHYVTVNEDRCKAWNIDPERAIRDELGSKRSFGILVKHQRATITEVLPVEAHGVPATI